MLENLCSPVQNRSHGPGSVSRVGVIVLSALAGLVAVVLLVAGDTGGGVANQSALLAYYQPWQVPSTPNVNMQQLISGYVGNQVQNAERDPEVLAGVRDAERGVMHALYRSANSNDDSDFLDPAVTGAPSYAKELNFLRRNLPSRRAVKAREAREAYELATRERLQEQMQLAEQKQQVRWQAEHKQQRQHQLQQQLQKQQHSTAAKEVPLVEPVKDKFLKTPALIKAVQALKSQAPPGMHLAWVGDMDEEAVADENGGRNEIPYFPMPPLDAGGSKVIDGEHVEFVAPGPCMLRDGTDMGYDDAECSHHQVIDDQYPEKKLITATFPSDTYVPDIQYPYIKGPYLPHLVDANDEQYQVRVRVFRMCCVLAHLSHAEI